MADKKMTVSPKLLDLLNQTLELEYTLIIHYPRIASMITNEKGKQLAQSLGNASVNHADAVAKAIVKLGGTPRWVFGAFPDGKSIKEIFEIQLEKEKLAHSLHRQITGLTNDYDLRQQFIGMTNEEDAHIKTVTQIISLIN